MRCDEGVVLCYGCMILHYTGHYVGGCTLHVVARRRVIDRARSVALGLALVII